MTDMTAGQAQARIQQLIDPDGYAEAQQIQAIEDEHAALAVYATPEQQAQLDAIKAQRIAAVQAKYSQAKADAAAVAQQNSPALTD